jgi:hypothetical protein
VSLLLYEGNDNVLHRLFNHVDSALLQRPTYARLINLYDNYIPSTGVSESVDDDERFEETAFLNAVNSTQVMQKAYEFLHDLSSVLVL